MGGMIAISVTYRMKHLVKAGVYSAPALMIQPALERLYGLVNCIQALSQSCQSLGWVELNYVTIP